MLKWNLPVYVRGENTNQWMLQNFKHHCSLRFSPEFFATQKALVAAGGFESGEGFIKLPYKRELPIELLKTLMEARVNEFEAQHAASVSTVHCQARGRTVEVTFRRANDVVRQND